MTVLQWRDELSVGVPAIDRDHQRLIDALNRLRRLDGVSDENAIASALNEVVQYTQGHFRREEMLMRLSGYPGYQAHLRLHQRMATRAVELENRFRANPKSFRIDSFYNALSDWLVPHVLQEDAKLKPFVEKLEEARAA